LLVFMLNSYYMETPLFLIKFKCQLKNINRKENLYNVSLTHGGLTYFIELTFSITFFASSI
jgi:hypothetical protein